MSSQSLIISAVKENISWSKIKHIIVFNELAEQISEAY